MAQTPQDYDENNTKDIEINVIDLFKKYFKYNHINDKFESDGIKIMIEKIRYWINLRKPIYCCLPAFPAKSPNTEKVFSCSFPDYGEYLALHQLYQFANQVSNFYKYGCQILIIADGRVYGDLIGVNKQNIKLYKQHLLEMIKKNKFDSCLKYTNLAMELNYDENESKDDDNDDDMNIINIFLKKYGNNIDVKQISKNIKKDNNLQTVYFGMSKFLEYDCSSKWNKNKFSSISSVRKYCKDTAKNMMIRSNAYSNLIKTNYPNHIRLSIHGHDNEEKFAVCLFKSFSLNYCITPWHNVTCKMLDNRILLIKNIVIENIIMINKQKLSLWINCRVSIYSRSKQMWCHDGFIDDIQYIDDTEWLIVSYNNGKNVKKIQRFSNCLNPIMNDRNNDNDNDNIHPINIKHNKEYFKQALNFNKWSIGSTKMFKIMYNDNKKWCYSEL